MANEKKGKAGKKNKNPKAGKNEDKEKQLLVYTWDGTEGKGDKIDPKVSTTGNVTEDQKFLDTPLALDFCNFTGFTLMQSFLPAPRLNLLENRPKLAIAAKTVCRCENFRDDIHDLNKKIADLNEELLVLKVRMSKPKGPNERELAIQRALEKINSEMHTVTDVLKQLERVRNLVVYGVERITTPPPHYTPPAETL